jgi:hypothetical protein
LHFVARIGSPAKRIASEAATGSIRFIKPTIRLLRIRWQHTRTSVNTRLPRQQTLLSFLINTALTTHTITAWLSIEITYGLYLSDHSILSGVETELVVLSGIMIQNLPRETGWHLRGTRRIGVSHEDVETIQQCVSSCVRNGFFDEVC